jgi:hypothetical protein
MYSGLSRNWALFDLNARRPRLLDLHEPNNRHAHVGQQRRDSNDSECHPSIGKSIWSRVGTVVRPPLQDSGAGDLAVDPDAPLHDPGDKEPDREDKAKEMGHEVSEMESDECEAC